VKDKKFISAEELLLLSFTLARKIWDDGYRPTHLLGVWRGGTPIAIAVEEFFFAAGRRCRHEPIKTSRRLKPDGSYEIEISGLDRLAAGMARPSRVLFIDDIFDTGLTMEALVRRTRELSPSSPEIRIATIFYKPGQNRTGLSPDYYVEKTSAWLVFPHEIAGLSPEELRAHKPELTGLVEDINQRRRP
jgi:hypoxanthine phosphoribosyltransferase